MVDGHGEAPPEAVVVVGASSGGVEDRAGTLAAVHAQDCEPLVANRIYEHRSVLSHLLGRTTGLHVKTAENEDEIAAGCVYVAPPDVHLILDGGRLRLDTGPPVHYVRPSADVLLGSLAGACDGNCVAVVLSGSGTDGAAGAKAVKLSGGHVLVQDPDSSEHGGMPRAAIATGAADSVITLGEIAPAIVALVSEMNPN
jgi:chemotaxis response regulator CheB